MILLINGSPKPHGNIHRMLEKVAQDSGMGHEVIHLARLKINPCLGCVKCANTNRCIQNDDMTLLYDKVVAADALVLGAPVYFGFTPTRLRIPFLSGYFLYATFACSHTGNRLQLLWLGGIRQRRSLVIFRIGLSTILNATWLARFTSTVPHHLVSSVGMGRRVVTAVRPDGSLRTSLRISK